MILNFKEVYKSANDCIRCSSGALEKTLAAVEKPKKSRRTAPAWFLTATAAAIAVTVSSVYFYGGNQADEPTKLIQKSSLSVKENEKSEPAAEKPENTKQYTETSQSPDFQSEVPADKTFYAESEYIDSEKNKNESISANELQKSPDFSETANNKTENIPFEDNIADEQNLSIAAESMPSEKTYAAFGVKEDSQNVLIYSDEISYDEYCEKTGYDVISKAVLPEGVTIIEPDSLFIDGNHNPNTFYTSSENSKKCYITISENNESVYSGYSEVTKCDGTFEISAKTNNLSIYALCTNFSEDEANALSVSLIN